MRSRLFLALDCGFQIKRRAVAIANGISAKVVEGRLSEKAESAHVGFLFGAEAAAVLLEDRFVPLFDFDAALIGKLWKVRREFGKLLLVGDRREVNASKRGSAGQGGGDGKQRRATRYWDTRTSAR